MAGQTTYEVYVLQGTRWEIHSRHNAMRKDAAIQEAKSLEASPNIDATKVVKEVYDAKAGRAEEYTIYKSEALKKKAPTVREVFSAAPAKVARAVPGMVGATKPSAVKPAPQKQQRRRKKGKTSLIGVVVKVLLVMLFSMAIAALFTGIGAMQLPYSELFGISLAGGSRTNVLFIIFVLSFVLSALLTAKGFLKKSDFEGSSRSPGAKATPPRAAPVPATPLPPLDRPVLLSGDEEPSVELGAMDVEVAAAAEKATAEALPPAAAEQKRYMMSFLSESLINIKDGGQTLDNFNKFGVNLYLAGAAESLSQQKGLGDAFEARILADGVQVMGFNRKSAESFVQKREEYLLADPRYMQIYQAGRTALSASLQGDTEASKLLSRALSEWNKPKAKPTSGGLITVMFTDMVGSTALTQARGDAVAQEVVRAHNKIVRMTLSQFVGKEVKHTGDGIMASFDTTSHGVEAAIYIQRGAEAHTRANPDLPLLLKIGINAGEPIREDDDLFGSTVQLSARITDKANAGQIFVSELVRGICAGKEIAFRNAGNFTMKGFSEPTTLYEAIWSGAAANDAASASVAAQ